MHAPLQVKEESAAQQLVLGGSRRSMGSQGPLEGGHDFSGFLHRLGWAGVCVWLAIVGSSTLSCPSTAALSMSQLSCLYVYQLLGMSLRKMADIMA